MTETKLMTSTELCQAGYKVHHSSLTRGYIRVGRESVVEYNGRFGKGYKVYSNNSKSSRYCHVTYLIKA